MSAGYEIQKGNLDFRLGESATAIRDAFRKIDNLVKWLALRPKPEGGTDPLTTMGYTVDEAYAIRLYAESLFQIRETNESTFELGRQFSGLE